MGLLQLVGNFYRKKKKKREAFTLKVVLMDNLGEL